MRRNKSDGISETLKQLFPLSWRDTGVTLIVLLCSYCICWAVHWFSPSFQNEAMIFFLALVLIARYTDGYFYDIVASFMSVVCVNFSFTYPYYVLDFSISGYPFVFAIMLFISLSVSTLTSRAKQRDKMREQVARERMYSNLLRSVSHDIRTPLTSIAGSASAILDNKEKLSEKQKDALLLDIHDEAQWLVRVVENILSVTRMGGENSHINKTPELPEEIISSAVARITKLYPNEHIDIRLPESVFFVPMDPILIEQVLFNVLENSVLHAKEHTLISITMSQCSKNVMFEISDNGKGASQKPAVPLINKLNEQFAGSRDIKRNMGIGLAVCRSIVLAHGGTMDIDIGGMGTTVRFTLPSQ